jgi:hypothetical protein
MPRKSSNLEFHVSPEGSFDTQIFTNIKEASVHAISLSVSRGQAVHIDVITWTKAAARKWAGDSGVEIYNEDPEASVHERIVVKAEALGRVA